MKNGRHLESACVLSSPSVPIRDKILAYLEVHRKPDLVFQLQRTGMECVIVVVQCHKVQLSSSALGRLTAEKDSLQLYRNANMR